MTSGSKAYLESISKHCYAQMTYYQFNTGTLKVSDKYRAGRLKALSYVNELTYEYLQEEKKIEEAFQQHLVSQMKEHLCLLDDKEYQKGLHDVLNEGSIIKNRYNIVKMYYILRRTP